jgi:hypothetical protein
MLVKTAVCRNGDIVIGKRHGECIKSAVLDHDWKPPVTQEEQGFVDGDGKYYSRADALIYAKLTGQASMDKMILFSEDLW